MIFSIEWKKKNLLNTLLKKIAKKPKESPTFPEVMFVGVAIEDCKIGDIVAIKSDGKGAYKVSPMKEPEDFGSSSLSKTSSSKSSFTFRGIDGTSDSSVVGILCKDDVVKDKIEDKEEEEIEKGPKEVKAKKRNIIPEIVYRG